MKKMKSILVLLMVSVMLTGCIGNPYQLGIKYMENGEYSKAVEEFEKAIEEEKNLADSYRGLGISLWEQQEYKSAYEAFEQAITNGTKVSATLYSLIGNCAMQTGKYIEAASYYELGIAMEDASDELLKEMRYNLIAAYEYAGNVEEAKAKLSAYLEAYPEDESALREAEFLETR